MNYRFFALTLIVTTFSLVLSCGRSDPSLFQRHTAGNTGIDFENRIVETDSFNILTTEYIFNGGGVSTGDFNNDGLMDLFFTGNQVSNKLYLNQGDFNFKDVTDVARWEEEASG